jgi:hypothetical protein
MRNTGKGITKELPTILETTAGAVAGNVVAKMIEDKDVMKMGKYAGLLVAGLGLGAAIVMPKNNMIKNVGIGMITAGFGKFASSLIDKPEPAKIMGLQRRLNGESSYIGAISKINDTGYQTINNDNVANL